MVPTADPSAHINILVPMLLGVDPSLFKIMAMTSGSFLISISLTALTHFLMICAPFVFRHHFYGCMLFI